MTSPTSEVNYIKELIESSLSHLTREQVNNFEEAQVHQIGELFGFGEGFSTADITEELQRRGLLLLASSNQNPVVQQDTTLCTELLTTISELEAATKEMEEFQKFELLEQTQSLPDTETIVWFNHGDAMQQLVRNQLTSSQTPIVKFHYGKFDTSEAKSKIIKRLKMSKILINQMARQSAQIASLQQHVETTSAELSATKEELSATKVELSVTKEELSVTKFELNNKITNIGEQINEFGEVFTGVLLPAFGKLKNL